MHHAVKLWYSVDNPGEVGSTAVYPPSWIRINSVRKVANTTLQLSWWLQHTRPPMHTTAGAQRISVYFNQLVSILVYLALAPQKIVGSAMELTFLNININTILNKPVFSQGQTHPSGEDPQWMGQSAAIMLTASTQFSGGTAPPHYQSGSPRTFFPLSDAWPPQRMPGEAIVLAYLGFRADLSWWRTFVRSWNAISYLPPPEAAFDSYQMLLMMQCVVEESMHVSNCVGPQHLRSYP